MNARGEPARAGIEVFEFAGLRLVPARRELTRQGVSVRLGSRALDVLIALLQRAGQIVDHQELLAAAWPNVVVQESNLRVHVAALRQAIGQGGSGERLIANVPGRGYSFVAEVHRRWDVEEESQPQPDRDGAHRLPASQSTLIGRDDFVAEIVQSLPQLRLMSIIGPGGIGKTAVAVATAERLAPRYRDGVRFIDLAALSEPQLVAAQLASIFRLPASDAPPLSRVASFLSTQSLLLVLDNCEHVITAVCEAAEEIWRHAPGVHVLATSRERLRAQGEHVRQLGSLATPPARTALTAVAALQFPAVQLFAQRCLAQDAAFELTDADAVEVARLCTRLDGLPLALELAATCVPLFGLRGVATRLDDPFSIMTKGRRMASARHQTLRAVIDWSYEALGGDEKAVWRRLSVFRGPFTLAAAEAIARDVDSGISLDVIDIVGSLVEKSLLAIDEPGGECRYRMLESMRLYAAQTLHGSAEARVLALRHAEYFCARVLGSGDNASETPSLSWLEMYSGDAADIRTALAFAFSAEGDPLLAVRLTGASAAYWFKLLLLPELRSYLERAIDLIPAVPQLDSQWLMRLQIARGHSIFHLQGPVQEVSQALNHAFAIAEQRGDVERQLHIAWALYGSFTTLGDYSAGSEQLGRVRALRARHPEVDTAPLYSRMSALCAHLLGDQAEALEHAEQALRHARAGHGGVFFYDHKLATSSHYCRSLWLSGRPDEAAALIDATIDEARRVDQPFALGYFLVFAACPVSFWSGNFAAVRRHLELLFDVASGITCNVWHAGGRLYEQVLNQLDAVDAGHEPRIDLGGGMSLSPHQEETLCTLRWRLLEPRPLESALAGNVNWSTAEVLRAYGERLLHESPTKTAEAEALFVRSIELSRRQHALAWELRATTSLARSCAAAGHAEWARELLAAVYARYGEGFETTDVAEARRLLDALDTGAPRAARSSPSAWQLSPRAR
ncbi:MAG: winged helix-turn-helix domain-containing protein [Polyangiaceae bacterium]